MKRRFLIIAIFLLAGAVVNVAVAWGIIALSIYPSWPRTATEVNNVEWPHSVPSHWPERATTIQPEAFGRSLDRYQARATEERDGELWLTEQFLLDIVSVGWPFRALQWEIWIESFMPQHTWWFSGIAWRSEIFGFRARSLKRLPTRPLWPGFAVNTIFYATVLWLLIPGPFVLRRCIRVRRGLCPACAYPMGESDVCSECGKALRAGRYLPRAPWLLERGYDAVTGSRVALVASSVFSYHRSAATRPSTNGRTT